jgi:hypothetical protein
MTQFLGNILFALTNMGGCKHSNYSAPRTPRGKTDIGECRITCLDCGATAPYNQYEFKQIGPWEKVVVQTNRSEIIPHVYSTC